VANFEKAKWSILLQRKVLGAHQEHIFTDIQHNQDVKYLRLNIFPDGGISRLRVFSETNKKQKH
jgi:allantoicase